jgi:hypothetical protein
MPAITVAINAISLLLMVAVILSFRHIYRARAKLQHTASLGHAHVGQRIYTLVWTYVLLTAALAIITTIFFFQIS